MYNIILIEWSGWRNQISLAWNNKSEKAFQWENSSRKALKIIERYIEFGI